jgi:peptide deformylase
MTIIQAPDPILDTPCIPVEKVTAELVATAKEMLKIMREANGIGLAANQVGLSICLLVIDNDGQDLILFNPKLMQASSVKRTGPEGCLSYPGQELTITRPDTVKVKYRDVNNKVQYVELQGLSARVFMHEREHLIGENFKQWE